MKDLCVGARSKHAFELQHDRKSISYWQDVFLPCHFYMMYIENSRWSSYVQLVDETTVLTTAFGSVHATVPKIFREDSTSFKVQKDHNLGYFPEYISC